MRPRRFGFTLVELLVTMGILAILATLVLLGSNRWIERGRSVACVGNLRSQGIALQGYLRDHQQQMPTMLTGRSSKDDEGATLDTVLAEYVDSPKVFVCPSDRSLAAHTGTSYFWNNAMNGQNLLALNFLNLVQDATRIPLIFDKEGWHRYSDNKVNFLYADGHVAQELSLFTSP